MLPRSVYRDEHEIRIEHETEAMSPVINCIISTRGFDRSGSLGRDMHARFPSAMARIRQQGVSTPECLGGKY